MKKGVALVAVLGLTLAVGLGAWLLRTLRPAGTAKAAVPPAGNEKARPAAAPRVLSFACPGCRANVKAPADQAGRKGKCPRCGQALLVPAGDAVRVARPQS
jgi:hypothetical protein